MSVDALPADSFIDKSLDVGATVLGPNAADVERAGKAVRFFSTHELARGT
jgi:hypothetical protein